MTGSMACRCLSSLRSSSQNSQKTASLNMYLGVLNIRIFPRSQAFMRGSGVFSGVTLYRRSTNAINQRIRTRMAKACAAQSPFTGELEVEADES